MKLRCAFRRKKEIENNVALPCKVKENWGQFVASVTQKSSKYRQYRVKPAIEIMGESHKDGDRIRTLILMTKCRLEHYSTLSIETQHEIGKLFLAAERTIEQFQQSCSIILKILNDHHITADFDVSAFTSTTDDADSVTQLLSNINDNLQALRDRHHNFTMAVQNIKQYLTEIHLLVLFEQPAGIMLPNEKCTHTGSAAAFPRCGAVLQIDDSWPVC